MKKIHHFFKSEDGATAIEYALIAAGIAVVILGAVQFLGGNLQGTFGDIACELKGGTYNPTTNVCD